MATLHDHDNISRLAQKTKAMDKLGSLQYNNDPKAYKSRALAAVAAVCTAGCSIEDPILRDIGASFDASSHLSIRYDIAKQINTTKIDHAKLHSMRQEICSQLEALQPAANSTNTVDTKCDRCGRKSHVQQDCYAKTNVNGVKLTDPPPSRRGRTLTRTRLRDRSLSHEGKGRGRGGRGRGRGGRGRGGRGDTTPQADAQPKEDAAGSANKASADEKKMILDQLTQLTKAMQSLSVERGDPPTHTPDTHCLLSQSNKTMSSTI